MSIARIHQYYRELEEIELYSGETKELSIKRCFAALLNEYAQKKGYLLVEEVKLKNLKKQPDGCIFLKGQFEIGYWEAKDTKDNLEKELQNKINIGYPTSNLIIENSETLFLLQDGQKEEINMKIDRDLDKILTKFINYEPKEIKDFKDAIQKFNQAVPKVVKVLEDMINEQIKNNIDFQTKRKAFFKLCQVAINPQISYNNIDEMLIQHILTEEIFLSVMGNTAFHKENTIAKTLIEIEETFFVKEIRYNTLFELSSYYDIIKSKASGLVTYRDKQDFLKMIYENFYKAYNPKNADKLGIVYTPSQVVKFMIESTDYLLEKYFDKNLTDKNVHILDPATGTGTFITDIIDYIPAQYLEYKYKNEIHANEVAILPYYIANLNIEFIYQQKMKGKYAEFKNLCFVDTLDNVDALKYAGKQTGVFGDLLENAQRIKSQNDKEISVIIGNPPYNAKQQNFNDQNANRLYENIDKRIKQTFVKYGSAQNQITLYDMYVRFYSWAMDRIAKNGIIAFITNRSFIDSKAFDGFRKTVQDEFDEIYIVDLKGDIRRDNHKEQGGNVFDIMTGVAIAFFIKIDENDQKKKAKIHYHTLGNGLKSVDKLDILQETKFKKLIFDRIRPDEKNNWLNQTDNDFDTLIPLIDKEVKAGKKENAIFQLFSRGVVTQRDEWVFDFSKKNLEKKIKYLIDIYTKTVKKPNFKDKFKIKWDTELTSYANRKIKKDFELDKIIKACYRPFVKQYFYYDRHLNGRLYQWENIIRGEELNKISQNKTITFTSFGSNRDFNTLVIDTVGELHVTGANQCVPFYFYNNEKQKIDNITNWALELFIAHYQDKKITKLSIFHYVYAVLHTPAYLEKYAQNLKQDFPRIPLYVDFWKYEKAGEKLMNLHLDYENRPTPALPKGEGESNVRVTRLPLESLLPKFKVENEQQKQDILKNLKPEIRLKIKNGVIEIDSLTTISNIPAEVWEYKLGNRNAIEWILDQYKPYKSSDKTIEEEFTPYHFEDYKEELIILLLQVIEVSLETMKIKKEL